MKKTLCRRMLDLGAAVGLTLVAGCAGSEFKKPAEDKPAQQVKSKPQGNSAQQVKAPDKPQRKAGVKAKPQIPDGPLVLLDDPQRDLLRLKITSTGAGADEKALSEDILQRTLEAISADDAKVVSGGNADLRLTIRSKLTTVDRDIDYVRMNCVVDVEMKSADGKRIFGVKKIEVVSPRRVLGKAAAISKLGKTAAEAAAEWCRKELKRIADTEVGAVILAVQLPAVPKGKRRDAAADSAAIKSIRSKLARLPKLVSCRLVSQDAETGLCRYRVVYFISQYPDGPANEAGALLKSIKQK